MANPSLLGIIVRTLVEYVVAVAVLAIVMTLQGRDFWPFVIGLAVMNVGVVIVRVWRGRRRQREQGEKKIGGTENDIRGLP